MRIRTLLVTIAALVLVYFSVGACLLRFGLAPLVLPHVASPTYPDAPVFLRQGGDDGNAVLVRRYGTPTVGCVVFFPGQHGLLAKYREQLFPAFTAHGIAVLAVAYPGQNGAPGKPRLPELMALTAKVVSTAKAECPDRRVVIYGRSLGSMVAAYAAGKSHPAGLILESAAPSFGAAVRRGLRTRWYLAPLALLPVSRLLPHDYSLAEALQDTPHMPAIVFQGTADQKTPLAALQAAGILRPLHLVVIPGGEHSTMYLMAREQIVQTALSMLRGDKS